MEVYTPKFALSVLLIFGGFFIIAFFTELNLFVYILGYREAFTRIIFDVIVQLSVLSLFFILVGHDKLLETEEILSIKRKSEKIKWKDFFNLLNNTPKEIVVKMFILAFVSIPLLLLIVVVGLIVLIKLFYPP